jgi:hypothetical protein
MSSTAQSVRWIVTGPPKQEIDLNVSLEVRQAVWLPNGSLNLP